MKKLNAAVVIVGAGPAGCATALFLHKAGIRNIVICEKSAFPRDKVCGDALSGKVVEVLKKLDPELLRSIHLDQNFLGSWGVHFFSPSGQGLRVPFRRSFQSGEPAPGYLATRLHFDQFLFDRVSALEDIRILENTAIRHYQRIENGISAITAKEDFQIEAPLWIGADGPSSGLAKQFSGWTVQSEHLCYGLRAYYEGVSGMDEQHFIELHFFNRLLPGYFWIFPLPNGKANVGLGIRADVMKKKNLHLKPLLQEILEKEPAIAARFKNARLLGEVKQHALPLGSVKRPLSGDHFMLTGDAAALIDPFTGEGIGNALMSGMMAAETAVQAIKKQSFNADSLSAYDAALYRRLGSELKLSYRMQKLVNYPWLFNLVVRKANSNPTLRETISCMFEDLDLRDRLRKPSFYFNLLFSRGN